MENNQKNKSSQRLLVGHWFEAYYNKLYFKGLDQFRIEHRVEEAIMETFEKLLKKVAKSELFIEKEPFPYIWRAFYNSYIDLYRKDKRVQERIMPLENAFNLSINETNSEYVEVKREIFKKLLFKLPKKQRTAILLFWEGFSYREISENMQEEPGSISYLLRAAKSYIRDHAGGDQLF